MPSKNGDSFQTPGKDTASANKAARIDEDDNKADSIEKKRLLALSRTRTTALYRYWSSHSRISYKEVNVKISIERLETQLAVFDESDPISVESCQSTLEKLDGKEAGEIDALSMSLQKALEVSLDIEKQVRDDWLAKDPRDIPSIPNEINTLRKEYKGKFTGMYKRLQNLTSSVQKLQKQEETLRKARMKARTFHLDNNEFMKMLDAAKAVTEASDAAATAVQTEDLRVLQGEQAALNKVVDLASAWGGSDADEEGLQNQLHLRILGGLHVKFNVRNRLARTEYDLKCELAKIQKLSKLHSQGKTQNEVEQALEDLDAVKRGGATSLYRELEEGNRRDMVAEKERQESVPLDYERARAIAIEQGALYDVRTAKSVKSRLQTIQVNIQQALQVKREVSLKNIDETVDGREARKLLLSQMEAQTVREELDLQLVHESLDVGYLLLERYVSEVVQGTEPSTRYVQELVRFDNLLEHNMLRESIQLEDTSKRLKKRLDALHYRDFETKRLGELGRGADSPDSENSRELEFILENIQTTLDSDMAIIDVSTEAELSHVDNLYEVRLEQRMKIHETYSTEVENVTQLYEHATNQLTNNFLQEKSFVFSQLPPDPSAEQVNGYARLLELEQQHTTLLVQAELQYTESLYQCFKMAITKVLSQEQMEDELRNMRASMGIEADMNQKREEEEKGAQLVGLLKSQVKRRKAANKFHDDLESSIQEQNTALISQEDQAKAELTQALDAEMADRAAQLQSDEGLSAEQANAQVKEEFRDRLREALNAQQREFEKAEKQYDEALMKAKQERGGQLQQLSGKEDEEAKALRKHLREVVEQSASVQDEAVSNVLRTANNASKEIQDALSNDIKMLHDRFNNEVENLKQDLEKTHLKEKADLTKRLKARRGQRKAELTAAGKSPTAVQAAIEASEAAELSALDKRFASKVSDMMAQKRRERAQAQKTVVDVESSRVRQNATKTSHAKDAALERVKELRAEHKTESETLENELGQKRKQNEEVLKKRLSERRNSRMQALPANNPKRYQEEMLLIQADAADMSSFQEQVAAEEEAARASQRLEHSEALGEAVDTLKKAETDAASAKAVEATVRSFQKTGPDVEDLLENENEEKVRGMRATLVDSSTKKESEDKRRQSTAHGKLQEQLLLKRLKKDQELKDKEEQARAALEARQKAAQELRAAKMEWTKKLQDAMATADTLSLFEAEKENFVYQETLGRSLVPEQQMAEAVQMVQKARFDQEMTQLLTEHIEARVAALRTAVAGVIDAKSQAKIRLMEQLYKDESLTEDEKQEQVSDLSKEYEGKQASAEKNAIDVIEPDHMQQQMALRQRQLQDTARVVALYSDPETLAKLQSEGGKSQEEELREYKEKIERDRKLHEQQLAKEREETERALREKMTRDMEEMKAKLVAEQEKIDREFEQKKAQVMMQKEAHAKKTAEEPTDEGDLSEKQRIREEFDKESAAALAALEESRISQKSKLADRLARRRVTAVVPNQAQMAALQAMAPADAAGPEEGGGAGAQADAYAAQAAETVRLIESKLDRIEKVVQLLEKRAAAPPPVSVPNKDGAKKRKEKDQKKKKKKKEESYKEKEKEKKRKQKEKEKKKKQQPLPAPAPVSRYVDKEEPAPGDELLVVPDEEITTLENAKIDYGRNLAMLIGLRDVKIKVAKQFPTPRATGNAFVNSYRFYKKAIELDPDYKNIHDEDVLYIHRKRVGTSGEFGLMVIHALSHIKVNPDDLSNDVDPKFLAELYKNLKILSQDLYKKSNASVGSQMVTARDSGGVGGSGKGNGMGVGLEGGGGGGSMRRTNSKANLSALKRRSINDSPGGGMQHGGDSAGALGLNNTKSRSELDDVGGGHNAPANYFSSDSLADRMKLYSQMR